MPKVLIADKLSPAAVAIFKERGVDADVKTGLSKEELIKIVDQYDGIAIRSATKLTADVLKAADVQITLSRNRFRICPSVFTDDRDIDRLLMEDTGLPVWIAGLG